MTPSGAFCRKGRRNKSPPRQRQGPTIAWPPALSADMCTIGCGRKRQPASVARTAAAEEIRPRCFGHIGPARRNDTPPGFIPEGPRFAVPSRLLAALQGFPAATLRDRNPGYQVVGKPSEMRFPAPAGGHGLGPGVSDAGRGRERQHLGSNAVEPNDTGCQPNLQ